MSEAGAMREPAKRELAKRDPAKRDPAKRDPWTVRVATWSARHRWPVFALWFVATIGVFALSTATGGIRNLDVNQDPNERRLESEQAYEVLGASAPQAPSERLVFVIDGGAEAGADPVFQAAVANLVSDLGAARVPLDGIDTPTFSELVDPFRARPQAGLVSADGTTVQVVGQVPGERDRVEVLLAPVPAIVERARGAMPGATIHVVGSTFINRDIQGLISHDLDNSFRLTLPLTFAILLLAFGAIVASLIPLVLAMTSLAAAFGLLGLYSQVVGAVSPNATQLIVLIGLAVAVDYSLFMVTRFRAERRRGRAVPAAIQVASSTAGRAVFFSGLAVMISLAGLVTLGISLFTSMAVGTIGVVLVSVIGSLTFLPATLAIVGDRVDRGRPATWLPRLLAATPVPALRRRGQAALAWLDRRADRPEGSGPWAALVTAVMRRPLLMTVVSSLLLLALATPILHLRIGITDITGFPSSIDGVAGIRLLNEKWPQGTDLRLDVVVTKPSREDVRAAIERLKVETLAIPGVSGPPQERLSQDGQAVLVSFTLGGGRNDEVNRAAVRTVRNDLRPEIFGGLVDVQMYVSGQAAAALDTTQVYLDGTPRIFAFVLGLSFLLMLVAFHSIVIPIKAILLNLLSTGAAFGVLVLVFHDGWFAEPLGITPGGVIESWVPIFIFTILFGLSMDYHLFILTRIKEARDRGLDSRAAVARGISVTSGTITSAAAIMVVVFAAFVAFKFVFIQQLGLGLAVAVFIDATLIRSVLLPATMTLLGDWNWWLPPFLRWLPRITIEGERDEPEEAPRADAGLLAPTSGGRSPIELGS
jgi:RND superfamily putative drug exporter